MAADPIRCATPYSQTTQTRRLKQPRPVTKAYYEQRLDDLFKCEGQRGPGSCGEAEDAPLLPEDTTLDSRPTGLFTEVPNSMEFSEFAKMFPKTDLLARAGTHTNFIIEPLRKRRNRHHGQVKRRRREEHPQCTASDREGEMARS